MKSSVPLVFLVVVLLAAAGGAGSSFRPVLPSSDYPEITSCSAAPATLKNNRINFIRFRLKFKDDEKNLYANKHSNQVEVELFRSTESSGPKQGYKVGQLAYDFTLLDKSKNRKTLSTYLGKVVLLNLTTMWCTFCKEEMPHLQSLNMKYKGEGLIILNGLCENYAAEPIRLSDLAGWVQTYHASFPVLADLFYGVYNPYTAFSTGKSFPYNIFIDRTGKIRWTKHGFSADTLVEMEAKILKLLAE